MISRVAESCFWLHRYVERADNVARLLRVNRSFVLDVRLPEEERWRPVVVVSGEEERLSKLLGDDALDDGELVQEYLTWNEHNPISIMSSIRWARENARTIREAISVEMWENLNVFYLWMTSRKARSLYKSDRDAFYLRVRDAASLFLGAARQTVLHDECFAFMQLGVMLERAGQTARIVDVKHRSLAPSDGSNVSTGAESAIESAQATALLRSCSAIESFFKKTSRTPSSHPVVEFLYGERLFPRSVVFCLTQANALLGEIRSETGALMGGESAALLNSLLQSVQDASASQNLKSDVHQELTRVIEATSKVCAQIHSDFFDPSFEESMSARGGGREQGQVQS